MMRFAAIVGVLSVTAALTACGSKSSDDSGTMTVQGTVSSKLTVDNARAVAIGSDGRTFWSFLDQDRDFTLQLPVGQSYRVIVANERTGGGQTTLARMVVDGASGRTEWLGANVAGTVDLGTLTPVVLAGSLSTQCDCNTGAQPDAGSGSNGGSGMPGTTGGSGGSNSGTGMPSTTGGDDGRGRRHNHGDDNACHEKKHDAKPKCGCSDDAKEDAGAAGVDDTDVCSSGAATDVTPSNMPDTNTCGDREHHAAGDATGDDKKSCGASAGDGGTAGSGAATKGDKGEKGDKGDKGDDDGDDDHQQGGATSTKKADGASCDVCSSCASGHCVAGTCGASGSSGSTTNAGGTTDTGSTGGTIAVH